MAPAPQLSFHHLGLACRDLAREADAWLALGYQAEGAEFHDPLQKVRGRFLIGPGPRLELLSPTMQDSPVSGYLERGAKLYHQGFEVEALEAAIEALKAASGARVTVPPTPAVAFGGRRIAFMMTPTLNLIELIEAPVG